MREAFVKHDMDLVRRILIEAQKAGQHIDIESLVCDKHPLPVLAYHVELMAAHGLLDAKVDKSWGGESTGGTIEGLTWDTAATTWTPSTTTGCGAARRRSRGRLWATRRSQPSSRPRPWWPCSS